MGLDPHPNIVKTGWIPSCKKMPGASPAREEENKQRPEEPSERGANVERDVGLDAD